MPDYVKKAWQAGEFIKDSSDSEVFDINDHKVNLRVEKIQK